MNIFYLEWDSYCNEDVFQVLDELGHNVIKISYKEKKLRKEQAMERLQKALLQSNCDFVFSFNYFPEVSECCKDLGLKYVAWVYDSPHIQVYSYTVINPCNYIFLFDYGMYDELKRAGIETVYYLPLAVNEKRQHEGKPALSAKEFLALMREKKRMVEMTEKMNNRSVNEGFSGGEKKKNEIFQMAMLEPTLAILDETDSGLDIDALRVVAEGVNKLKTPQNASIVITHYQRLLDYIIPDFVHVLADGKIVRTGGKELALELEEKGYAFLNN